jgi:uncharacterized phage infection (PIP) family protein YhgE
VINTSQTQSQTEQLEPAAPRKKSGRKSILALSVFALGLNAAAAAYTTSPSNFALPNFSGLVAELLPHEGASKPIPDAVVAALNDIQSDQQHIATAIQDNGSSLQRNTTLLQDNGSSLQRNTTLLQDNGASLQRNTALLQENGSLLQQNSALLQQDATKLDTLRSSLTDEQSDVKTISAQLSTLIAKVDSLQNAMTSEITSSIPNGRARTRLSGVAHKRLARSIKPERPKSVGGAPLTTAPASVLGPLHNPAG